MDAKNQTGDGRAIHHGQWCQKLQIIYYSVILKENSDNLLT